MRLRKTLFLISSFFVYGCLRPNKPSVEVCVIDMSATESICGMSGQGAATTLSRKPLSYLDKGTSFKPDQWKIYKDYIDSLELYATDLEQHCK